MRDSSKMQRALQRKTNNLPGEYINYNWDRARGIETSQSETFIEKEQYIRNI
jgi:hypothetical protein